LEATRAAGKETCHAPANALAPAPAALLPWNAMNRRALRVWGLLGIAAFACVLCLAGVWMRHRSSIPEHITAEKIQGSYATLLGALRQIAQEQDLEDLATRTDGELLPWELFQDRLKTLARPEVVQAAILLPSQSRSSSSEGQSPQRWRQVIVHTRPGLRGHEVELLPRQPLHELWSSPFGKARIARGWFGLDGSSPLHTIEYFETAEDGSGRAVQLMLSLRLDALRDVASVAP
jgi:hypothetical protein